ncbi:MAG: stage III sporulation protein AG [Faecalibacterium sp.]
MKQWQEKLREQLKNKKLASKLVIYLGLLGMALILISELFGAEKVSVADVSGTEQSILAQDGNEMTTVSISTEETYRANLEESLASLITQMEGAGKTIVMITLVSGEEVVYAQNVTQSDSQISESHVLLESGEALSEKVYTPTVCGVAVLCEGGDSILVEAKITTMVTALFDISSNRVTVEKLG